MSLNCFRDRAGILQKILLTVCLYPFANGLALAHQNRGSLLIDAPFTVPTPSANNFSVTTILAPVTNNSYWANQNILNVYDSISGFGSIYNASKGVLNLYVNASNTNNITNNGVINLSGTASNIGTITNYQTMNLNSELNGSGAIANTSSGVVNINANANIANVISNAIGGIINMNGTCAEVNNSGTMNVNNAFNGNGIIRNNGVIYLNNNINMPGQTLINTGTIVVKGNQTIIAALVVSPGTQNFSITNEKVFDSLTATGIIDYSNGGIINVDSKFTGLPGAIYSWEIVSAPAIITDDTTVVNISPTLIKNWDYNNYTDSLEIILSHSTFTALASGDLQTQVATALDNLPIENGVHLHATLLHALSTVANQEQYNTALSQLLPNVNAGSHQVALQNASFNKVETRLANVREPIPHVPPGVSYGDLTTDTALWSGVFGSVANQKAYSKSFGYHANCSGVLIGGDHFTDAGSIYGLAFAVSNSNINEAINLGAKTRILGFHLILYGSMDLVNDSFFVEWLATGVTNKNKGVRYVNINKNTFGINSSYRTAQGGVRINLGQSTNNDCWQFSLIEMLSYAYIYQPSYHELNSAAALEVTPKKNNNILTLGGGVRLSLTHRNSWLIGARELRLMGTYDVITSNQFTTASFLNSVSDFTVAIAPSRWSFQAGATYSCTFFEHLQFQFSYDFQLRTAYTDNSAEIKIRYLF